MVSLYDSGIYLVNGTEIVPESESGKVKKLTGSTFAIIESNDIRVIIVLQILSVYL